MIIDNDATQKGVNMLAKKRKGLSVKSDATRSHMIFTLYNTNILEYQNGTITLNTGGWKTNHTKKCMNENLPSNYSVFQKDFEWYVNTPNGVVEFQDGMEFKL